MLICDLNQPKALCENNSFWLENTYHFIFPALPKQNIPVQKTMILDMSSIRFKLADSEVCFLHIIFQYM